MSTEEKTMIIYNEVLNNIFYPALGRGITVTSQLTKVGREYFGNNYVGTFPSDKIPNLGTTRDGKPITKANVTGESKLYCLLNLDNSAQSGSHWIAVCYEIPDENKFGNIWVYDSFGRQTSTIIPQLIKKFKNVKMADPDAEQAVLETDCGARSLAFIYVFDRCGAKFAKTI